MVRRLGMLKEKRWNGFGSVIEGLAFFWQRNRLGMEERTFAWAGWLSLEAYFCIDSTVEGREDKAA